MNITINGQPEQAVGVASVAELVVFLGYENKRIAVEHNGVIVPKSMHEQTKLNEGDQLEIVVAVGGG